MEKLLTVIMYHYVRDLENSRYPNIKGRTVDEFKFQLDYIQKNYTVVRMEEVIDYLDNGSDLPEKPALLTFDDGYIDHYLNVYPILSERELQGSFFIPYKTIENHEVLDVNKIHFILASCETLGIIEEIKRIISQIKIKYNLFDFEFYYSKLAIPSRFDNKEVIFIKRLLQRELEEDVRKYIIDELFKKYVTDNEMIFSKELYMNIDQIKCMKKNGMFIGAHGFNHYWLGNLDEESQSKEISLSKEFLKGLGCDMNKWVMCYPYGSYNDKLISILKSNGCVLGLSTNVAVANLDIDDKYILSRLDTNDIPTK